jgi:hypothetical protein
MRAEPNRLGRNLDPKPTLVDRLATFAPPAWVRVNGLPPQTALLANPLFSGKAGCKSSVAVSAVLFACTYRSFTR